MNPRTQMTPELRSPFAWSGCPSMGEERPLIESGALDRSATPTYIIEDKSLYSNSACNINISSERSLIE